MSKNGVLRLVSLRPYPVRITPRCHSQTPLLLFDIAKVQPFF